MSAIYNIKTKEIEGSTLGITPFIKWLKTEYSLETIYYYKGSPDQLYSSDYPSDYYLTDDGWTKTLVKLERSVNEGYIWNSTNSTTEVLGEWNLIPKKDTGIRYIRIPGIGRLRGNFENKQKLTDLNAVVGIADLESLDIFKRFKFNNLIAIQFHDNFNEPIMPGSIPHGVKYIRFGYYYNQKLIQHVIPDSVVKVSFGNKFNQVIKKNDFPNSVTTLIFGQSFVQKLIEGSMPTSLKRIEFGAYYNKVIGQNVLPKSVYFMAIGNKMFNKDVYIPESVTDLTICSYFKDSELANEVIPKTVKYITFKPLGGHICSIPSTLGRLSIRQIASCKLIIPEIPESVKDLYLNIKNTDICPEMFQHVEKLFISSTGKEQIIKESDIPKTVKSCKYYFNHRVIFDI